MGKKEPRNNSKRYLQNQDSIWLLFIPPVQCFISLRLSPNKSEFNYRRLTFLFFILYFSFLKVRQDGGCGRGELKVLASEITLCQLQDIPCLPAGDDAVVIDVAEIRLVTQLGSGNYGTVWKGICRGQTVAVKQLNKKKLDREKLQELQDEIDVMR